MLSFWEDRLIWEYRFEQKGIESVSANAIEFPMSKEAQWLSDAPIHQKPAIQIL